MSCGMRADVEVVMPALRPEGEGLLMIIYVSFRAQRTWYRPLLRTAAGDAYSHTTQLLDGAAWFEPSLEANLKPSW